jgi:hypothetical protein
MGDETHRGKPKTRASKGMTAGLASGVAFAVQLPIASTRVVTAWAAFIFDRNGRRSLLIRHGVRSFDVAGDLSIKRLYVGI